MEDNCDVCILRLDSDKRWISYVPFSWFVPISINDKPLIPRDDGFICLCGFCEIKMEEFKLKDAVGNRVSELSDAYLDDDVLVEFNKKFGVEE